MRFTYLAVDLLAVLFPFIFTFHPRLAFHRTWSAFWPACLITALLFVAWDIFFTSLGVWGFNNNYLLGINVANLPLEEILFFICIPYACVFTYHCIKVLSKREWSGPLIRPLTWLLVAVLVVVALLQIDHLYTSVTFIATAALLVLHLLVIRSNYLGRFYIAWLVIFLCPFLITNGILTGSFIDEPIVWYNNTQNLGIRVLTIPIEDFIYGMLMFLMNVTIYEYLSHPTNPNRPA